MDLEQHHIIKFLRIKGLKLGEIDKKFPVHVAWIRILRRAEKSGFIKSSSGEPISGRNMLVGEHFSTTLMPKFLFFLFGVDDC
jgi:hypothetical protein